MKCLLQDASNWYFLQEILLSVFRSQNYFLYFIVTAHDKVGGFEQESFGIRRREMPLNYHGLGWFNYFIRRMD